MLEDELFLIVHLMIAGRFHWKPKGAKIARKYGQAAFDFANGTLLLTEAGTKKRASIHLVRGEDALHEHDPGGLEVLDASLEQFREALTRENHTVKRSLTDPHLFSGIGNAYSDEILHRARLSPIRLTQQMTASEIEDALPRDQRIAQLIGSSACAKKEDQASRKKSRPFAPTWPCTANTASPVRSAARPCSALFTPRTKPITVRHARPAGSCWPTDRCRGFLNRIGREP